MAISTTDPSNSLFEITMYSFIENNSVVPSKCQALQIYKSNIFCPYETHNISRGRHVKTKKGIDPFQSTIKVQRRYFYPRR